MTWHSTRAADTAASLPSAVSAPDLGIELMRGPRKSLMCSDAGKAPPETRRDGALMQGPADGVGGRDRAG